MGKENATISGRIVKFLGRPEIGPVIALTLVTLLFVVLDQQYGKGSFATYNSFRSILNSSAIVAVPAIGMTILIISGGIDLSVGTALTLCGTVLAIALKKEWDPVICVACCISAGAICGLVNGVLVTTLRIAPFVVTLGTMSIFLGLGSIISNELTIEPKRSLIPGWLDVLTSLRGNGIPLGVFVAIALAIFVSFMLNYTVFGRHIYAIGSNELTAKLCGIPVQLYKLAIYMITGIFVAFGGVYYFANTKIANPQEGLGRELEIIAAVVIGGASLNGGRGTVIGTLAGACLAAVIKSGCTNIGLSVSYQRMAMGCIVILAVAIDQLRNRPPAWLVQMIPSKSKV